MRRFFLPQKQLSNDRIDLPADVHKHLQVLRLVSGDRLELLDGQGLSCQCELVELTRKHARAKVIKRCKVDESCLPITLYQGVPKGEKLDLVLQKGTELGIGRFCPVTCQRSQQPGRKPGGARQERWDKIVREAARQSGRNLLPPVDPVTPLAQVLAECREELRLVPWEEGDLPLADALPENPPSRVAVLIGPEGGLSAEEIDLAVRHGFQPVSLGPRILRTETAGFAVAGILQYLYGDMGCNLGLHANS